ncbi:hypothetical protein Dia5BBH33_19770 [Dialister hominis]|uniref:Uncharacterized protein n=1 Tax=Dialister hominis TaxID=2582419 RepID=A0A8D4UW55_9FIRM|nr:hypothetical protein Dia5BBH33_19770 [Dialister hominis]
MAALFIPPKNVYAATSVIRMIAAGSSPTPKIEEMISIPGRQLATAERRIPIEEITEDRRSARLP